MRRLKWLFALHIGGQTNDEYIRMAKVAVISAVRYTTLEPFCLLDVDETLSLEAQEQIRSIADWLGGFNVNIIRHRPLWAKDIDRIVADGATVRHFSASPLYRSAAALRSTFLRIDIPVLGFTDDFVLYTDVDVIFTREITLDDFGPRPKYFAVGTEVDQVSTYFNAGVMLYNIRNMQKTYQKFIRSTFSPENLSGGLHFGSFGPGDQGALNYFYRGEYAASVRGFALFNWKPYWRQCDERCPHEPAIIHWHGPKPSDYASFLENSTVANPLFKQLLSQCAHHDSTDPCWHWNRIWDRLNSSNLI
jgi:lipopolysaccharide biosynthesis glycosyltransferase